MLKIIIMKNKNLKGIDHITNMNYIFSECSSLLSLPDLSKWNTINLTNMSYMFDGCSSLAFISDISKWNTINVKGMNGMFGGYTSLSSLPDISIWDNNNVRICFMIIHLYHLYQISQNGIHLMLKV